ncbi:hypothetical protein Vafri_10389 [Volvox africanus]|uniref:CAAX prenyl protease 2/Lysostaphin resistance protein A-like domain-containing protein n=1 Tax=Volvox africanus TaxID=51714 RepID=A0A8J4F0M5_9CHLO|nr:hypothetical protein Vafri_10389 [Volvox africanus]
MAGFVLGPMLWSATAAAVALRTGADILQLSGVPVVGSSTASPGPSGSDLTAGLIFGGLLQNPGDLGQWLRVMATSAISPAAAEELLYRGFLLTAMQQRFGAIDATAISAALFAATHLSLSQFFPFTLLGTCCGVLALASGSVLPAIVAHASYNATGIVVGMVVALGVRVQAGSP